MALLRNRMEVRHILVEKHAKALEVLEILNSGEHSKYFVLHVQKVQMARFALQEKWLSMKQQENIQLIRPVEVVYSDGREGMSWIRYVPEHELRVSSS